jgi:type IV pilus assembly protein PilF
MNIFSLAIIFFSLGMLQACSPLTAAGIAGSIINRTADYGDTQTVLQKARSSYDSDEIAVANLNLGIEYLRRGEYEIAMVKLNRAKEAAPNYAPVYDALGVLSQYMGLTEEADIYFKKAIQLSKRDSKTLNNYGQFLCSQNRQPEAEKYFLEAVDNPLYETPEITYSNLGTCANRASQIDEAVNYFEKALSINPGLPSVLIQMSEINYAAGNYPFAHDYLNRYLEHTIHTPRSLWLGIRIENELGDKNAVSSYALLLRNKYPESSETQLLNESELK